MSQKTFTYRGRDYRACSCNCHVVGWDVRHIVPCCDLCYDSYIDLVDGKKVLNENLLDAALEKAHQWREQNGK